MAGMIKVDPQMLEQAATKIDSLVGQYEQQYKTVFSKFDALKACWDGSDNLAYVTQVKGFEEKFINMQTEMQNYAKFLKDSAKAYRNAQQEIAQSAKKLTN